MIATSILVKVILIILGSGKMFLIPVPNPKFGDQDEVSASLNDLEALLEKLQFQEGLKGTDDADASPNLNKDLEALLVKLQEGLHGTVNADASKNEDKPVLKETTWYNNEGTKCHMEEKIVFENVCEPFTETTCYTQNKEICEEEMLKNCTAVIEAMVERICFNVTELICSLREDIHYQTLRESYQVQRCFITKDRICDTIFNIEMNNQDDYQCIEVETPNCFMEEMVLNDVTCTESVDFHCKKFKADDDSDKVLAYGDWAEALGSVVCERRPTQECYNVPRMINSERCVNDTHRYCEKFTNLVPAPYEQQNCHFERKKICEIQDRNRIRKGRKYSYRTDCQEVPREVCDSLERKEIQPVCSMEKRFKCSYVPEEHCEDQIKEYCFMDEKVVLEEVCDKKVETSYL
eukprot:GFUD01024990.1.p1 GENE.GFUD01024990.1~~GFUD01024990.1.p1  ORF type:complete len:406 (-),score=110.48 GFUD01024990.1:25-1242(-)